MFFITNNVMKISSNNVCYSIKLQIANKNTLGVSKFTRKLNHGKKDKKGRDIFKMDGALIWKVALYFKILVHDKDGGHCHSASVKSLNDDC